MLSLLRVALGAAYHVVSALPPGLAPLAGGLAPAAAIVGCTMAVRLLLLPLSYYAVGGQASQARLLPQARARQKRHAGQPDQRQRELAALSRGGGTGMFAGGLPALLPLPFFSVMYQLFRSARLGGRPNGLLGHELLTVPLGSHWLSGPGPLSTQGTVFIGLFALLAVVAWIAARVARKARAAQSDDPGSRSPDQARKLGCATRVLPYATMAVAAIMPLATGLYLLTTTTWTVCERAVPARRMRPLTVPGMYLRDRVRHDEGSTRGGHPCITPPSPTSPARTWRSPS